MGEKERIKILRVTEKLNQTDFGKRIGLTTAAISDIERGKNAVTPMTRKSICREFGISEEWLRTGNGDMYAPEPEDELDALVMRYHLTARDRVMIQKFLSFTEEDREVMIRYVEEVATELARQSPPKDDTAVPVMATAEDYLELSPQQAALLKGAPEKLHRQLDADYEAEQATGGGPSDSPSGNSATA